MTGWMPIRHTVKITNLRESERRIAVGYVLSCYASRLGGASRCIRRRIDGIGPIRRRLAGGSSFGHSALRLGNRRENESKHDQR